MGSLEDYPELPACCIIPQAIRNASWEAHWKTSPPTPTFGGRVMTETEIVSGMQTDEAEL